MKIDITWALGYKLFTIAYGFGLIGALLPSHEQTHEPVAEQPVSQSGVAPDTANPQPAGSISPTEPLTRAALDGIYFDVIRAVGQGEQLEIELQAYNTGADRSLALGRAKGILEPALFATVFDEQGGKWYADQVRIANATSTSDFLPETKLITGVPMTMLLTFGRMPAARGNLQIRTIPRLEVPVVVELDQPHHPTGEDGAVVLVFRRIPVVSQ